MVLTQIMDNGGETEYHAKSLHTAEYRLLCIANYIKTVGYDGYIKSNNIKGLPGVYMHISPKGDSPAKSKTLGTWRSPTPKVLKKFLESDFFWYISHMLKVFNNNLQWLRVYQGV